MDEKFLADLLKAHQQPTVRALDRALLGRFLGTTLGLLFPEYREVPIRTNSEIKNYLSNLQHLLESMILQVGVKVDSVQIRKQFIDNLPQLKDALQADAQAIFQGDPAAQSVNEVVISYPGFFAIAVYRIANLLLRSGLTLIPRIMTEHAHERTGIDIHPGATIGSSFCIDHGTGVVIGETTIIGSLVKIYQGVTLGGLSVSKNLADKKRHPTIEDRVIIYSNATVLGGDTVIGHDSVIGGNVWLTESVPPFSKVYHRADLEIREGRKA
jgi:serine O-acetyltransferase